MGDFEDTLNKASFADVQKVLTTSSTAQIPLFLDPNIQQLVIKRVPLVESIKRLPSPSLTFNFVQTTALNTAAFYGEGDSPTITNTTKVRQTVDMKTLRVAGGVSGLMQAASLGFYNALEDEVKNSVLALKYFEEQKILYGNGTEAAIVSGDSAFNANAFTGLDVQIRTNNFDAVTDPDATAGAISVKLLNKAIRATRENGATPDMIVTSFLNRDRVAELLIGLQRYVNTTELKGGYKTITYGDLPVYASSQVNLGGTWTAGPTYTAATVGTQLYVLDSDVIEMRVLKDLTYERLAKNQDEERFQITEYEGLVVRNEKLNAKISGLV